MNFSFFHSLCPSEYIQRSFQSIDTNTFIYVSVPTCLCIYIYVCVWSYFSYIKKQSRHLYSTKFSAWVYIYIFTHSSQLLEFLGLYKSIIYIYIYVCVCVCVREKATPYIIIRVNTWMNEWRKCSNPHKQSSINTLSFMLFRVSLDTYQCLYTHTHTYIYIYIYIYAQIYLVVHMYKSLLCLLSLLHSVDASNWIY